MTTRKILHAADIHLDSPLQKLDRYDHAPYERIRGASRVALQNMVQFAIDQEVDLVVLAGDLYDGDWTDQNTGLFFVAQASRLVNAGIPMTVIRGNHDASNLMTSSLPLPLNPDGSEIMLSDDKVDLRVFESIGVAVHGRSYRNRNESENLALAYPKPLGGMFNIGLLHTCLEGAEGHAPYAPCKPSQLAEKNYDYWALGHIHQRGEHGLDGAAPVVFSGNIQGRHIREQGAKGCVLIDVDSSGQCTRRFKELDVVRWELCKIDALALSHTDDAIDQFRHWLGDTLATVDGRLLVVRVQIEGPSSLHGSLHRQRQKLQAALRATAVAHGTDQVWLETLRINTTLPSNGVVGTDMDGPMKSLQAVFDDLQRNDQLGDVLQTELRSLIKKLPEEITNSEGEAFLDFENDDWAKQLVESAAAEIQSRLQISETPS